MRPSRLGPGQKSLERGSTFENDRSELARRSTPARRAISPASLPQKRKVHLLPCAVCGTDCSRATIDPAHIAPRGYPGACDEPACTIPLCRAHHREFDDGKLDLLPHLVARFAPELAHALEHYDGDLIALLQRVTGERWQPVSEAA